MTNIHIDFETRSECKMEDAGAWSYTRHASTSILCLAYAIDDQPVQLLDCEFFKKLSWMPKDLQDALETEGCTVRAHNAFFERSVWTNILVKKYFWPEIPIGKWRCSAAKVLSYSLPWSLEGAANVMKLENKKDTEGHSVMMRLSKPKAPSKKDPGVWDNTPEKFEKLYSYCMKDVEAERELDNKLPDLNPFEQNVWFIDQEINTRGIYIDRKLVQDCIYIIGQYELSLNQELSDLTNGDVIKGSQLPAMKNWLTSQGFVTEKLDKGVISDLRKQGLHGYVDRVLAIRQELGRSSVKKYQKIAHMMDTDGYIRGNLVYHRASTGRWGGTGVQVQNLLRGTIKDNEQLVRFIKWRNIDTLEIAYDSVATAVSSAIRGAIIPSPGYELLVSDYNAIETRVLFWLAGESVGLDKIRKGTDLYLDMASVIYSKSNLTKESPERQLGKMAVLGCGYQMGAERFKSQCLTQAGITVDSELAVKAVGAYRERYRTVVQFWYDLEAAAISAITFKKDVDCGPVRFGIRGRFLVCKLPSGRYLFYCDPRVELKEFTETERKRLEETNQHWKLEKHMITFSAVDTRNQWSRQSTYGGTLCENITQGVARDLLANAMVELKKLPDWYIVMHAHDELVTEAPIGKYMVEDLNSVMCKFPNWAKGCPIAAEGWKGMRYKK